MLAAVVDTNVLVSGLMRPGSWPALVLQDKQRQRQDRLPAPRPDIDALLAAVREKEKDTNGVPAPVR